MTTRIDRRMAKLKDEKRPALVTYFMGGDPDYETCWKYEGAAEGGPTSSSWAPFSDRWPTARRSRRRVWRAQGRPTLKRPCRWPPTSVSDDETPIVLMGYYSPIYNYGVDAFRPMPDSASTA